MDEQSGESWGTTKGSGGMMGGMRWRIVVSIVALPVWMIFILLYAFLWSGPYTLFQNQTILIVSFLAVFGIIGGVWGSFGMRFSRP